MNVDETCRESFEQLRQQAKAAGLRGDFDGALEIFEEALRWARNHGEQDDLDLVCCGRSAVLIHQGRSEDVVRDLQKILMRSVNSTVRHLAAYNLSIVYEFREDFKKSHFYIQLAHDQARQSGSADFLVASDNQIGNLLTRESKFEDAITHYREARELVAEDRVYERLVLLLNAGYCHMASGRLEIGFQHLFQVRRSFIRHRVTQGPVLGRLRLSLCFGYLEIGRGHKARLHGIAGLEIAEGCGEADLIKKALYLLGEAEKLAGNDFEAFKYYARLQEQFYPDHGCLPDLLLSTDTKELVNLWA